jgi:aspartate kinase
MRVFKFGGASVKDADGVRNVYDVLQKVGYNDVLIVVSAMGKTTNTLEVVLKDYFDRAKTLQSSVQEVKKYHYEIIMDLFDNENHPIFQVIDKLFTELDYFLSHNKS